MAEKPLAPTLDELEGLHPAGAADRGPRLRHARAARRAPPSPSCARRSRRGAIGTPLVAHNQKSYRWGNNRPETFKDRRTFPGIAPSIGIHVFDWLLWILGDRYQEVSGWSSARRGRSAACASHAAYLLRLRDAGMATVTMDYLRPEGAPVARRRAHPHRRHRRRSRGLDRLRHRHADRRRGRAPAAVAAGRPGSPASSATSPPGTASQAPPRPRLPHVLPQWEVFRATEVALKTQVAVETGQSVDLRHSAYRPPA